jgi:hypothetical protein
MTNQITNLVTQLTVALPLILTILGVIAFLVSIVVQVTKEIKCIQAIPTKTWTLVVSMVICTAIYFIASNIASYEVTWYYILCIIIASFPVSYISTYGWDTFNQLWQRLKFNQGGK